MGKENKRISCALLHALCGSAELGIIPCGTRFVNGIMATLMLLYHRDRARMIFSAGYGIPVWRFTRPDVRPPAFHPAEKGQTDDKKEGYGKDRGPLVPEG